MGNIRRIIYSRITLFTGWLTTRFERNFKTYTIYDFWKMDPKNLGPPPLPLMLLIFAPFACTYRFFSVYLLVPGWKPRGTYKISIVHVSVTDYLRNRSDDFSETRHKVGGKKCKKRSTVAFFRLWPVIGLTSIFSPFLAIFGHFWPFLAVFGTLRKIRSEDFS